MVNTCSQCGGLQQSSLRPTYPYLPLNSACAYKMPTMCQALSSAVRGTKIFKASPSWWASRNAPGSLAPFPFHKFLLSSQLPAPECSLCLPLTSSYPFFWQSDSYPTLAPCYSECGPQNSSISISWEPVRNAVPQAPFQAYWTDILPKSPGD